MCDWIPAERDARITIAADAPNEPQYFGLCLRLSPELFHVGIVLRQRSQKLRDRPLGELLGHQPFEGDVRELHGHADLARKNDDLARHVGA